MQAPAAIGRYLPPAPKLQQIGYMSLLPIGYR